MRKTALTLALLLILTACSGGGAAPKEYDPEAAAKAVVDSGAFSETLEPLDADLITGIYGLDPVPDSAVAYSSTGATAEEVVVLKYADKDSCDAGWKALQKRVEDQRAACDGYLPAELPKLDKALISQVGNTVLLVVASDSAAASKALGLG